MRDPSRPVKVDWLLYNKSAIKVISEVLAVAYSSREIPLAFYITSLVAIVNVLKNLKNLACLKCLQFKIYRHVQIFGKHINQ